MRRLSTGLMVLASFGVLAMLITVIVNVAGRAAFDKSLQGTLEMTQYWWMMTAVFGGLGYTQLRNENIRATVVTDMLPRTWRRASDILAIVLLGALSAAFAYWGWYAALDSFDIREAVVSGWSIPIWPFVFMVPLGCAALTLQCIAQVYEVSIGIEHTDRSAEVI